MLTSEQIRAARAMLRWEQRDLAVASKVSLPSIQRLETKPGPLAAQSRTIEALRSALDSAGVEFTNDGRPGVRMRQLRVGDRVRPVQGPLFWEGYPDVKNSIGTIIDLIDDGSSVRRPSIEFANGRIVRGVDRGLVRLIGADVINLEINNGADE